MGRGRAGIAYALMVLMIVSIYACGKESAAGGGQPSAVVPEPSFTFNPVPEGMVVTHDYTVVNHGSDDLEITRIEST